MNRDTRRPGAEYAAMVADLLLAMRRHAERTEPDDEGTDGLPQPPPVRSDDPEAPGGPRFAPATYGSTAGDGGEPRFTTRDTEDEVLIVADLRGVARDEHQTEVDLGDESLILTIDERFVCRVPVDDGVTSISEVSVKNQVLEVRLDAEVRSAEN